MTTSQLSVRLPTDTRDWLNAHASLTGRSLNETINQMLSVMLETDPLDQLAIQRMGSRFVIASLSGESKFGPYRTKDAALMAAKRALEVNGFDEANIIDDTVKEAA